LLTNISGNVKPGHFTGKIFFHKKIILAIMGPSGSGKTTLLNFLSGRLVS